MATSTTTAALPAEEPSTADASAILALSAALANRSERVEELELLLDRKTEEQEMLAGNLCSMQAQLAQLRDVVTQRLAEGKHGGASTRAPISGKQKQQQQQPPPPPPPQPAPSRGSADGPVNQPVSEEMDDDDDDENGPVYTWPDGSLHNIPPPQPQPATNAAGTAAAAGAAEQQPAAAKMLPSSLMPEALRQPLRQISRDLDEALSQPAAAVGEKLASFAKSGEQLLERLRPSSRVQ